LSGTTPPYPRSPINSAARLEEDEMTIIPDDLDPELMERLS
jgi:hypothetical protein